MQEVFKSFVEDKIRNAHFSTCSDWITQVVKTKGKKKKRAIIFIALAAIAAAVFLIKPGILQEIQVKHRRHRSIPKGEDIALPSSKEPAAIEPESVKSVEMPRSRIAIIIDDVGYPSPNIDAYGNFDGKLTFAVLPFQTESRLYAHTLHQAGFEVMIHIPMEPDGYPEEEPGKGALFVNDSREDVELKLEKMLQHIPHATGANNHMGSRATQDFALMTHTLTHLNNEGFYFVDSLTTPHSVAGEIARQLPMGFASRDIFLDNHNNVLYIEKQFQKLKSASRERGWAIGIGHIQNNHLLSVLNRHVETLHDEGFELVFVSELMGI
jgi:polysaccharide deacetylase 2 family uncharacterized protein YibQ